MNCVLVVCFRVVPSHKQLAPVNKNAVLFRNIEPVPRKSPKNNCPGSTRLQNHRKMNGRVVVLGAKSSK